jgi:hypothetical protein
VFPRAIPISRVTIDPTNRRVTIVLKRPIQAIIRVTAYGGIRGANGAAMAGSFTAIVR